MENNNFLSIKNQIPTFFLMFSLGQKAQCLDSSLRFQLRQNPRKLLCLLTFVQSGTSRAWNKGRDTSFNKGLGKLDAGFGGNLLYPSCVSLQYRSAGSVFCFDIIKAFHKTIYGVNQFIKFSFSRRLLETPIHFLLDFLHVFEQFGEFIVLHKYHFNIRQLASGRG